MCGTEMLLAAKGYSDLWLNCQILPIRCQIAPETYQVPAVWWRSETWWDLPLSLTAGPWHPHCCLLPSWNVVLCVGCR